MRSARSALFGAVDRAVTPTIPDPHVRLRERAAAWGVVIEAVEETDSSLVAFGHRSAAPVVIKLVKRPCDEWCSGAVLQAFAGRGVVRVHEHTGGALLLERLRPGRSLVALSQADQDAAAIDVLAGVVAALAPNEPPIRCTMVTELGESFERYLATGEEAIPRALVLRARETFTQLARSQGSLRLLHGDLHHANVLFDDDRGWLAIDPKGLVGELEYELGAIFRNPWEAPLLFTHRAVIERRLRQLTAALPLNRTRVLGWAFAQSVLSVLWGLEDGAPLELDSPIIALAETLAAMLPQSPR